MAIQPVSDLILDVINQADPAQSQAATRALKAPAVVSKDLPVAQPAWASNTAFSQTLAEADKAVETLQAKAEETKTAALSEQNRYSSKLETMDLGEKLEGAVLQTFVKSMLPKEMDTVYGGGTAGSMWKGLMAEQLANQMARTGAVGLADILLPDAIRPNLNNKEA